MKKQTFSTVSVRLPKELDVRLTKVARKLDLFKSAISCDAIRAAVEAIESNEYSVQIPMDISVTPGSRRLDVR